MKVLTRTEPVEVHGEKFVTGLTVRNRDTGETTTLPVAGVGDGVGNRGDEGRGVGNVLLMPRKDEHDIPATLHTRCVDCVRESGEGVEERPSIPVRARLLVRIQHGAVPDEEDLSRLHLQQRHSPHAQPCSKALREVSDTSLNCCTSHDRLLMRPRREKLPDGERPPRYCWLTDWLENLLMFARNTIR